jgi:hypothetical protein
MYLAESLYLLYKLNELLQRQTVIKMLLSPVMYRTAGKQPEGFCVLAAELGRLLKSCRYEGTCRQNLVPLTLLNKNGLSGNILDWLSYRRVKVYFVSGPA